MQVILDESYTDFELELDEKFDSTTVNGWVVKNLDKLPQKGDKFEEININKLRIIWLKASA